VFSTIKNYNEVCVESRILPRDAILARYMLSLCVRLSVRPSVNRKPVFYQNG